jgi:hypothetical protein
MKRQGEYCARASKWLPSGDFAGVSPRARREFGDPAVFHDACWVMGKHRGTDRPNQIAC